MKLYTFPLSSNARKAEMAVHLLDLSVERVLVDLSKGDQRKPEFLAINPNGRVPVLVDGDLALSESNAIMAYLADQRPRNNLYPVDLRARALVNQWLFWQASHWGPAIAALNFENILKPRFNMGDPDPVHVKRNEDFFRQFAATLDSHLATRQWMAADTLTIADIALSAPLMYAVPAKLPVDGFANIQSWFARVRDLEAWRQTEPGALS